MIKPEITVEIDGKPVRLAMPLGGLEEVAAKYPQIGEVRMCLDHDVAAHFGEITTVVTTGLQYGESGVEFETLWNALGLDRTREAARDLIDAATRGTAGNVPAVESKTKPTAST